MALDAIRSPFSTSGGVADRQDLIEAVRVCSRTKLHQTIGFTLSGWVAIQLLRIPFLFKRSARLFGEYMADYNAYPEFWDEVSLDGQESPKTVSGYPVLARVMSVIKKAQGAIGEARAWQMPIGLLVWYDEQLGELDGNGKRFWDDSEEARIELALQKAEREAAMMEDTHNG